MSGPRLVSGIGVGGRDGPPATVAGAPTKPLAMTILKNAIRNQVAAQRRHQQKESTKGVATGDSIVFEKQWGVDGTVTVGDRRTRVRVLYSGGGPCATRASSAPPRTPSCARDGGTAQKAIRSTRLYQAREKGSSCVGTGGNQRPPRKAKWREKRCSDGARQRGTQPPGHTAPLHRWGARAEHKVARAPTQHTAITAGNGPHRPGHNQHD